VVEDVASSLQKTPAGDTTSVIGEVTMYCTVRGQHSWA
jgi:hypothetical protein